MGRFKGQPQRNTKPKIVETLAFDPFLPKENLINQMIRNMINPDNDSNQIYYVGQVVKIIQESDEKIDVRDVFYSASDNFERATKSVTDKKFNAERVILLVHIPSFLTNGKETITSLNYNNFTKIRVEYTGKEAIAVGNLVKIQFRDKNSFYDPVVVGIEAITSDKLDDIASIAKQAFDDSLKCKISSLSLPSEVSAIDFRKQTNPPGGYLQALKELDNIFSNTYVQKFQEYSTYKKKTIDIRINRVRLYTNSDTKKSVYDQYKGKYAFKYSIENFTDTDKDKPDNWLIIARDSDVVFIANGVEDITLRDEFYKYVKEDLASKFNFTFTPSPVGKGFELDINLRFIINAAEPNVKDYIEISDKLKYSPTYYLRTPPKTGGPQTVKQDELPDKCDNELSQKFSTYKQVYTFVSGKGNFNNKEGYRTNDNSIIEKFYNKLIDLNKVLTLENCYNLAGIKDEKSIILNNFYISSGATIDSYNQKNNKLNVNDLPKNLNITLNFLKTLRTFIINNESLADNQVLILPIQVFKNRPANTNLEGQDPNSRHYYGKAADIVIYLNLINEKKESQILQMQPEIVALYAQAVADNLKINIGHGIFLKSSLFYNHIELLDGSGLNAAEISKRVYTGNTTELEIKLEKEINAAGRIKFLKQYVKTNNNYKVLGNFPDKFIGIT